MASFNEIMRGGLNAILHKTLSMEEGAPAPQLSGDIVPTLGLEMDRPEWKFLAGESLAVSTCWVPAGGAGFFSFIQLWNPFASGVLTILEQHWINSLAAVAAQYCFSTVPITITTTGTPRSLDRRNTGVGAATKVYGDNTQIVSAMTTYSGPFFYYRQRLDADQAIKLPVILPPGTGFIIENSATNAILRCSFQWRERPMEPSEAR